MDTVIINALDNPASPLILKDSKFSIYIMDQELAQKAIIAALNGEWQGAIKINKTILKSDPTDTQTFNRLAKAYFEIGDIKKARALCKKIIKIDQFNSIANKNLEKWKCLGEFKKESGKSSQATNFIEEAGKTKLISLLYLGDSKLLSKIDAGDEVKLCPHPHRVSVVTSEGKYVGRLPDDLAARLRQLIKQGNTYRVLIKCIEPKNVRVFIRELERAKKMENIPSFPTEKIEYISFAPPELVHKKEKDALVSDEDG